MMKIYVTYDVAIVGTDGEVEIQSNEGPPLRMRTDDRWTAIGSGDENVYEPTEGRIRKVADIVAERIPFMIDPFDDPETHYERAIKHVVECLTTGDEPRISGLTAIRGTELVFASWKSSRQRGRVRLPLSIDDNPLESMCEDGKLADTPALATPNQS